MKKVTVILAVIAFMFSTNIFAQENTSEKVEKIAREVLKAYKTQDVELLKKNASGILKQAISKSYFEDNDVKEYIKVINNWDGKIRGIGYETEHFGPMTIRMATVYFADIPNSSNIYVVMLSKRNNSNWVMFAKGIDKDKKEEFNSLNKTLSGNKNAKLKHEISIEMASGDNFDNASVSTAIENFNKMNDDNFFIILKDKKDFMQLAYSKKGYTVQYKENGVQYEAKKLVSKEKAITLIKEYFDTDGQWKSEVEWEKI